jgi:uncharacterized protein with LGFP repeats
VRRLFVGLLAIFVLTGTILILPVYAAPAPEAEPVPTSTDEVPMGSVAHPAGDADVQKGTTEPVDGVASTAPTLAVSQTDGPEFSLVGVTWAYDPAVTDTVVQVRVRDDAGNWGDWTEVGTEDAEQNPDADAGAELRGGTAPLWTGPSTGVEVELVTRSGARPTDVQLDLVDPGTSEADATPGSPDIKDTAQAGMAMPDVYSRGQWGADEAIMGWTPEYAPTLRAATLHHTADSNSYTAEQVPAMMRSIYRYHAVSRGWGDIGYNVVVDKFGRRWEGRAGGLAGTVIGAHAGGFNSGTFGVSMLGTYDTVAPPAAVVTSVAAIIAWKFSLYGINPRGSTTLTSGGGGTSKYAAGARVTLPTIFGHRDVGATSCPGNGGYSRLPEIRDRVAHTLTQVETITSRYDADAGLRAMLGAPVGTQQNANGISWQVYQNGYLVDSVAGGVHYVKGSILSSWLASGGPYGPGGPTTDETCGAGGCYNSFERASIFWSPGGGTRLVKGAILGRYEANGRNAGFLGWPRTDETCVPGGCFTSFDGGHIFWSPATGARTIKGAIYDRWVAGGREAGPLGWPTSDETCVNGGCTNRFQGGALSWTPAAGVLLTKGLINSRWLTDGGPEGLLGWPTSEEVCVPGGCSTDFAGGTVYWSPQTGTHVVQGAILTAYKAGSGPRSIGFPIGDQVCRADGCWSMFESATIFWSPPGGAHAVKGAIYDRWDSVGRERGFLGWPSGDETCGSGGCSQAFAGGHLTWSPTAGTRFIKGAILVKWLADGAAASDLGWPISDEMCNGVGCANVFAGGGGIFWSPASGTHSVKGAIYSQWAALGREIGYLGWPTTDEVCGGGGCSTHFQGGSIYWTAADGVRVVKGAIGVRYRDLGAGTGVLSWPQTSEVCIPGGCYVNFRAGAVSWSPSTGARAVTGAAFGRWVALGRESGSLGWPTAEARTVTGGTLTEFQRGTILVRSDGSIQVTPS